MNVGEECLRITGASLDLVRTAKLVLEEYFSLGDTVNDMNKVLLKDSRPSRTSFQLGPPAPATPPVQPPEAGQAQARLNTLSSSNREHRSAFEVRNLIDKLTSDMHDDNIPGSKIRNDHKTYNSDCSQNMYYFLFFSVLLILMMSVVILEH